VRGLGRERGARGNGSFTEEEEDTLAHLFRGQIVCFDDQIGMSPGVAKAFALARQDDGQSRTGAAAKKGFVPGVEVNEEVRWVDASPHVRYPGVLLSNLARVITESAQSVYQRRLAGCARSDDFD